MMNRLKSGMLGIVGAENYMCVVYVYTDILKDKV